MSTPALRLYVDAQFASPYAMSAFVAMREKGLDFEISPIDLAHDANHSADYAARSLTERVPTLVHGDFSLSESSAIAEYIDEAFEGPRVYPAALQERARARQLQAWLRSDLMPLRQERSTEVIFYGPSELPLSTEAQRAADRLCRVALSLLDGKHGGLFDHWCVADLDLALMLNRLVLNGDPVHDRLAAYAQQQWQRPSVQAWVHQRRPEL